MARTREVFEASTDFTLAIEEEFQILDPQTLSLTQRFSDLKAASREDPVLAEAIAGELIESEIEIRSGKAETWADAVARQREARARLFRVAAAQNVQLAATGTHPWSPWPELRICDAQSGGDESFALAGLLVASVAQAAIDEDDGVPLEPHPPRVIEENFWRAIRYGLDGRLIDLTRREEFPAAATTERLLEWT